MLAAMRSCREMSSIRATLQYQIGWFIFPDSPNMWCAHWVASENQDHLAERYFFGRCQVRGGTWGSLNFMGPS
jgi:hypothetical protein